jgi:uncharacterized membrane protein
VWAVSTLRTFARGRSKGSAPNGVRYGRESLEFARLVNLSDAVFAIAMTLLAFKVVAPDSVVTSADLAPVLPQALAFLLSFAIVANFWWHHHHLFARVEQIDARFVVLNLALLGAVALVPFPTELIGLNPGAVAPAVTYLALMLVITTLIVSIIHRAERATLWRDDVDERERRELNIGWGAMLGVIIVAILVALWWSPAGLAFLLLTGPVDHLARAKARSREAQGST